MEQLQAMTVEQLIARIKDKDDRVRGEAWQNAGPTGAAAIEPLAKVAADPGSELEVGRAAKRAMWKIVRHVGRPGAEAEKKPVVMALLALLGENWPVALRRDVLWMLSEIAGDEAVDQIAPLLKHAQLREDARCCLQRIPGDQSLEALKAAMAAAEGDFKSAIAESLRVRGVPVPDVPSKKLLPTKQTSVKPVGRT